MTTNDTDCRRFEILLDIETHFGIDLPTSVKGSNTIGALINQIAHELTTSRRKVDRPQLMLDVQQILRRQLANPKLVLRLTDRF